MMIEEQTEDHATGTAGGSYSFTTTPRELNGNESQRKKVYVRKKGTASLEESTLRDESSQRKKKQIIVAKRVEIDGTSYSKKKTEELPLTVLAAKAKGPKRDEYGNVIETSLLGSSEEYLDLKQKLIGEDEEDREVAQKQQQVMQQQEEQFLQKVEKKKKIEEKEKQKNIQSMQIFQQTQYLKQERALQRWQEQQREWERINKRLATKMGKSEDELVISKADEFRNTLEEKEIIERSIFEEKDGYVDPLWRAYQPVGNALSGLFVKKKDPNTGPVEIIRRPSKVKSTQLRSSSSRLSERDFQNYKTNRIKIETLADDDLGGLEIIGRAIQVETERSMMEKRATISQHFPQTLGMSVSYEDSALFRNDSEEEPTPQGPNATIDKNELIFVSPANELCKQSVGIKNCGSTALYYRWRKKKLARALIDNFLASPIEEENLGLPKNPPILKHDVQRFYFADTKGVLLPGDYKDFVFMFQTPNYGIFFETWELTTEPQLPASVNAIVELKGIASGEDPLSEERQRIQKELARKEILHGVQTIVDTLIEDSVDSVLKRKEAERNEWMEYQKEQERKRQQLQELFDSQNRQLGVPFSMNTLQELQSLASRVFDHLRKETESSNQRVSTIPSDWNLSINELQQFMSQIEDFNTSESMMKELNDILTTATMITPEEQPHSAFLIGVIVRSLLMQMTEHVPEIAKSERSLLGLIHHPFVNPFTTPIPTAASVSSIPKERITTATSNHEDFPVDDSKDSVTEDEIGIKGATRRRRKRVQQVKNIKPSTEPIAIKKVEEIPPVENPEERKLEEVFHNQFIKKVSVQVTEYLIKMEELTRFLPKKPKVEPLKPLEQQKEVVTEKQPEAPVKETEEPRESSRKPQRRKPGAAKKTKKAVVVK